MPMWRSGRFQKDVCLVSECPNVSFDLVVVDSLENAENKRNYELEKLCFYSIIRYRLQWKETSLNNKTKTKDRLR